MRASCSTPNTQWTILRGRLTDEHSIVVSLLLESRGMRATISRSIERAPLSRGFERGFCTELDIIRERRKLESPSSMLARVEILESREIDG